MSIPRLFRHTLSYSWNNIVELALSSFKAVHKSAHMIVEPGSGDGAQLKYFLDHGCDVLGIEPSDCLASISRSKCIPTLGSLFGNHLLSLMSHQILISVLVPTH